VEAAVEYYYQRHILIDCIHIYREESSIKAT
jgi:hypothetical protein